MNNGNSTTLWTCITCYAFSFAPIGMMWFLTKYKAKALNTITFIIRD